MSASNARQFLLKPGSYSTIPLPMYFDFSPVIRFTNQLFEDSLIYVDLRKAKEEEHLNYVLFSNKDGRFAWRSLQLINPVLYVDLVRKITEESVWEEIQKRFALFRKNEKIVCTSMPAESDEFVRDIAESVKTWSSEFEKKSVELGLEFCVLASTDIADCYGSIYTHSIAWALHGKSVAKSHRNNEQLIGNKIDREIQAMQWGQTNGIPQGSLLMDFLAEIILGYADLLLSDELDKEPLLDYKILRYRDDYRIFTNSAQSAEIILKSLSLVLSQLGLKLNQSKTKIFSDVILNSTKQDKLAWIEKRLNFESLSLWEQGLMLYKHTVEYPNSGAILKPLERLQERVKSEKANNLNYIIPLAAIIVEIACKNPKTYSHCMGIISSMISSLEKKAQNEIMYKIANKFSSLPNAGYLQVWLQRIFLPLKQAYPFAERLCAIAETREGGMLWNFKWLEDRDIVERIQNIPIINREKILRLSVEMSLREVRLFLVKNLQYCL